MSSLLKKNHFHYFNIEEENNDSYKIKSIIFLLLLRFRSYDETTLCTNEIVMFRNESLYQAM